MALVLGHDGVGFVEAGGLGVEEVAVDDAVVLPWPTNCSRCESCVSGYPQLCWVGAETVNQNLLWDGTTVLRHGGKPVYALACAGTFAE